MSNEFAAKSLISKPADDITDQLQAAIVPEIAKNINA
jgi:hypothetical protein